MTPKAYDLQTTQAQIAEARRRALVVLDRVMTIDHVDDPNFAALLESQAKAREIRAAVLLDLTGPEAESARAILEAALAFSALLTLIDAREHLDDGQRSLLEDRVTRAFGRTLAIAATRGKLVVGAGAPAPTVERPAPPPKPLGTTEQPVVTAPAPPARAPSQPGVAGFASSAGPASTAPSTSDAPRPRTDAAPRPPWSSPSRPSPAWGSTLPSKRALIVDDRAEIGTLSAFFGRFEHGRRYEVLGASTRAEADSALSRGRLDLIVLDPQVKGLDGIGLLKEIRAADRTVPVIVVTGKQQTHEATEVMKAGIFAYIPKPCDFTKLEHLVALALSDATNAGST